MPLSRLTLLEMLDHMTRGATVMRSASSGKYTAYAQDAGYIGPVAEKIVASAVDKGFVVGEHIPGVFGEVEYSLKETGRCHARKCAQLRLKFGRRASAV